MALVIGKCALYHAFCFVLNDFVIGHCSFVVCFFFIRSKMATDFSVEDFLTRPTLEGLEQCKKADLCAIGSYLGVELLKSRTLAQLKEAVLALLEEKGVSLGEVEVKGHVSPVSASGVEQEVKSPPPSPSRSHTTTLSDGSTSPRLRVRLA